MPIRSADSSKIFNKEYVFSYPKHREEIDRIFSRLTNKEIDESAVSEITRIGYLPGAKETFEKEFEGNMPANYHSWIKAWTPKETDYLDSIAEDDEESELEEFDLSQQNPDEKDEKIATLLKEIEQRNTQLERLRDDLKQFQREVDNDSDSTLAALDETKDTLRSTQQRNHALSADLEKQKYTVEQQEHEIADLVSRLNDLTQLVGTLRHEIKELKAENKQDKRFYDESTAELDQEHQDAIKLLERKIRGLDEQIERLNDQHAAELLINKNQLESQISKLQKQIDLLHGNLEDTQQLLDASEENLSQARLLIITLEGQNQQALLDKQNALEAANSVQDELASTTETLQALQGEHTQLQERANTLEENNTRLLAQTDVLEATVRTKDSELQIAEQAKASLIENLGAAESRLTGFQSEMAALIETHERAITEIEQQLAHSQLSSTQLDAEKQQALQEKQSAEETANRLQQELASTAEALQALQGEHTQLQVRADRLEENNTGLLARVDGLETTVRAKDSELQAAELAKASLTENLGAAEGRLTALQSEMAALVASHEIAITGLEQQLAQSQLSIAQLDADKLQALLEKQKAVATADRLQLELSSTTQALEALQGKYSELQQHTGSLEKENARLLAQIDTLEKSLRTKVSELQTAEQAKERLTEELDTTKLRLSKEESNVTALQDEMAALVNSHKQSIRELNNELSRERDMNADLRQQIQTALREKQRADEDTEAIRGKVESTLEELELSKTAYVSLQLQLEQSLAQNAELLRQLEEGRANAVTPDEGSDSGFDDSPALQSPTDAEDVDLHAQPEEMDATNTNIAANPENEPEQDDVTAPLPVVNAEPVVHTEELPPVIVEPPRVDEPRPSTRRQSSEGSSDEANAFWSTFLQHGGVMEKYFHDQLVKKGQEPALEHWEEDELSIRAQRQTAPLYELVEIQKGDFIHSTAQFDKEGGAPGEKVVGKLVQDHTGRVINKTKDPLSVEQQCILALRQAEMILNNYNPTDKDKQTILIEGNASNATQGKRLIAALLLLKEQPGYHDKLKDIQIVSNVPGCELPKPVNGAFSFIKGKQTQEEANKKFINDFLPAGTLADPTTRAQVQKQVGDFAAVKTISHERVKAMKEVLHHGREIDGGHVELSEEEKAIVRQRIEDETLLPGDTIDLEGTKTPGPRSRN